MPESRLGASRARFARIAVPRLRGLHLRFGREILAALAVIHLLLGDQSGPALGYLVQASVFKMRTFVLRLDAMNLPFGARQPGWRRL